MKITINIKNCGEDAGTVGDLVRGLQSGKYVFEEKRYTRDGTVGLWLTAKDNKPPAQNIAGYNIYGLSSTQSGHNPFRYDLAECFADDRRDIWTDTAWDTIKRIALEWCRRKNQYIESEKSAEIHLLEVSRPLKFPE